MLIAEIILLAAEIIFLIYLVKKRKVITEEMRKLKLERQSVINLKESLEEDFIPEIEARKNKIIDEFAERLYNYHLHKWDNDN
jgi:ribosome biogenesis SPOUT family RNA methylase Rps3